MPTHTVLGLALLALALAATPARAQDAPSTGFGPEDLPGLQLAIGRTYAIDFEALAAELGTPGATPYVPAGILNLGANLLEFDTPANARAGWERLREAITSSPDTPDEAAPAGTPVALAGGEATFGLRFTIAGAPGPPLETILGLVQRDTLVVWVYATGSGIDLDKTVDAFLGGILERDGSGPGDYREDGTSSSGLWDRFPPPGDPLVAGLLVQDWVHYPIPGEDPPAG